MRQHEEEQTNGGLPAIMDTEHTSLAVSLARAEVDQQITTAHAFPRSITKAVQNINSLATLDKDTAVECVYALPRGGKAIKGPSIRLAEIIAGQWGNCRVGARVVHVDRLEKYVEAEGVFHDLESNTATTARVRRRISTKQGRLFDDDMIIVTGNAACSIAKRNAILGGVPKAVWAQAYVQVERVLAGDVKTLVDRRGAAMKAFAAFGVKPEQVFVALSVGGLDDIDLELMPTLIAMHSALKNGEATVEEMFPKEPVTVTGAPMKTTAAKLDALAKGTADPAHDPETGEVHDDGQVATDGARQDRDDERTEGQGAEQTAGEGAKPAAEQTGGGGRAQPQPGSTVQTRRTAKPAQEAKAPEQSEDMARDDEAAADGVDSGNNSVREGDSPAVDSSQASGPTAQDRERMEYEAELLSIAQTKAQKGERPLKLWLGSLEDSQLEVLKRLEKQIAAYLPQDQKISWPKR